MKIIADANMPGLELFSRHGTVVKVDGRSIDPATVKDADILLVRSVTRVDEALLADSAVRFVGSATIGTDHVDLEWLAKTGRHFAHAPGCNARAVAEYVLQALLLVCQRQGRSAATMSVAVIGMGNVGSRVARWLAALGLKVRACDPLLKEQGVETGFALEPVESVLDCDVISVHVPLTRNGPCPTWHLLDKNRLSVMGPEKILINTCRGAVVDNSALLALLKAGQGPASVLDVWEDEPRVPAELLDRVVLGSPHIAGYSAQGKENGTRMVYEAFCRWSGLAAPLPGIEEALPALRLDVTDEAGLLALLQTAYSLPEDFRRLQESLENADPAWAFDQLRKQYPFRQEMHRWDWQGTASEPFRAILNALFAPA